MTISIACNSCRKTGTSALSSLSILSSSLPSASIPTSSSPARSFTTSSIQLESRLKRIARLKKKVNLEQRQLKSTLLESTRPDPILGIQLSSSSSSSPFTSSSSSTTTTTTDPQSGPALWLNSDLNKIILTKEQVWGLKLDRRGSLIQIQEDSINQNQSEEEFKLSELMNQFGGPKRLNFGLDSNSKENRELLFQNLGQTIVEDRILDSQFLNDASSTSSSSSSSYSSYSSIIDGEENADLKPEERNQILNEEMKSLEEKEDYKKETLKRILDLKNSNGRGIQRENVRRIIDHFGRRNDDDDLAKEKGPDTGSPEVQAALLTYRIRNLHSHLETSRHDNSNRRAMNNLVFQRARILKYLKKEDSNRYASILKRIGVEARAVEGEISNRIGGKPKLMSGGI